MSQVPNVLRRPILPSKWTCPNSRSYAIRLRSKLKEQREKQHPQLVPLKALTVPEAARYLRAAEIAYPCHSPTISLDVKLRTENGITPVRGAVKLPHSVAAKPKICVFATGKPAQEALNAGADFVGGEELVNKVKEGFVDFQKCFAHPDMLPLLEPLGKILGPKGLMPNEKRGTLTQNLVLALQSSAGETDFRERGGHVRMKIARIDFNDSQIQDNVNIVIREVRAGQATIMTKVKLGIKEVSISSTNGPGIPLIGFT